jgi:histidine ammonia-lyase
MATHGARRLLEMARNADAILAIELLAAVEGMDWHESMRSSDALEAVRQLVRENIASMAKDWDFSDAVAKAQAHVHGGHVNAAAGLDPASL